MGFSGRKIPHRSALGYQRKQSGSGILTIIRMGLKVNQFVHVLTSVRHATFFLKSGFGI